MSSLAVSRLAGLASPGPNAYDTLEMSDRRGVNPLRVAAARRASPAMGAPAKPARVCGRYRDDEKRFISGRMARGNAIFSELGPGPAYALPSTYLAALKPLHPRAQLQAILPRSSSQALSPQQLDRPARPPRAEQAPLHSAAQHVSIGSERRRVRPASAATVRRYSMYGFEHDVVPPTFRRPESARLARSASSAAALGTHGAAARARPQSANGAPLAWRAAAVRGCHSTGVKLDPPGRSEPLRSAFVQPYGLNRVGQ
ncbi:hypothetical protein KFE25_001562 [Diacronema lutheri]|uniref:Uncharacterized protein n=1 Tax=Diacronema lutheri TaxID=2081491 RepID=A0A8J6C5M5_DIALT|nr:hypothetical protein KFE25_001562 [Diacronema lutheri]